MSTQLRQRPQSTATNVAAQALTLAVNGVRYVRFAYYLTRARASGMIIRARIDLIAWLNS